MKRSILKHGLLLSAASVALVVSPVRADNNLDISTTIKNPVKTSNAANNSAGDITIESNGIITLTQTGPAVTLDSSNNVNVYGAISNKDTSGAQGILIDTGTNTAPATITGDLILLPTGTSAAIDLTGNGSGKVGIGLTGNGTFTGDVNFTSGAINIKGDGSTGFGMSQDTTLDGNLSFGGTLQLVPSTDNGTTNTGLTAFNLAGTINKDVTILAGSQIVVYGNGSQGFVSNGTIKGAFANFGTLQTEGFQQIANQSTGSYTTPKGSGDPMAGSAVSIGGSILGGFFNGAGAQITMDGGLGLTQPVINVAPYQGVATPAAVVFGVYAPDVTDPGFSFYNRGTITGVTLDPNTSVAGVAFAGLNSTANVELQGLGILNSGTIGVQGKTTSSGSSPISAIALSIGALASNGGYVFAGDAGNLDSGLTNNGTIAAQATGDLGGIATAIGIGSTSRLNSLTNTGTISAVAQTNFPATVQTQVAYAINDQSGTLSKIVNSGSIGASATPLTTPGYASVQVAAYLANNTSGVTFTNTGSVAGDIYFGEGADTLSVKGTSTAASTVYGNIDFGSNFSKPGDTDKLNIGAYGVVVGQITEADLGMLDVNLESGGTLSVLNNSVRKSLLLNELNLASNSHLNIAVSTQLPGNVSISASDINIASANSCPVGQANACTISVVFSSFVPASGRFVLMQAPTGHLNIGGGDWAQVKQGLDNNIPWLFTGNADFLTNQAGLDQLVLDLTPKSSAQLGLSGYAAQMFPYANAALEFDDALGAGMISSATSNAAAQNAYSQFAPDASGGTRAIAISLTDHATGPVAARQRALRLYATQPGDLTLWGQEFAQQISDKGSDGLPGFKDSGFGFAMGADGGSADTGWYGGAFTFYTGNVDQREPQTSRNNTQWYMLSGYSTWRGKGLFLDTQITAGYGDLAAHRFITLGNVTRQADSKRSAVLGAAGLTTGANFVYGSTTITPNIALDGLTMREEGYTETGGGGLSGDGFDLKVNPVIMSSLRGFAGLNLRQDVNFGSFFLQPELRAGYRYDFLADRVNLTAAFTGVTGTGPGSGSFTVTGPQLSKGNLLGGASVSATTGAWSIGLNYDMLSGSNGSMTQVGSLSLVGRI